MTAIDYVRVFTLDGEGGNPCALVGDARAMTAEEMQSVARRFGCEAGFVREPDGDDHDLTLRVWVPNHEMEMCGHATIGALWVLARRGRLPGPVVRIETLSGPVTGYIAGGPDGETTVEITQPAGRAVPLAPDRAHDVLDVLGITKHDLLDVPLLNAVTSRVKTLVPIRDAERLQTLRIDMSAVEAVCRRIGSTGLYPYTVIDAGARMFEARQFPRSSGYPEDAATGIAASALAFGLLREGLLAPDDRPIQVFQGRAMGSLSEIRVRLGFAGDRSIGCLLGGAVTPAKAAT